LSAVNRTIGTYTRYKDALKHVTNLDQLEQELQDLESIPELSDDFQKRRIQAQATIKESQQAQQDLSSDLESINTRLQALSFDEAIIANQEPIEFIADEIQVYIKEGKDSKTQRAKIHQANRDATAALSLLNQELDISNVLSLRLSKPTEKRFKRLVAQHAKLELSAETLNKDLKTVEAKTKKVESQLRQMGEALPTGELESCRDRITELGNPELRLSEVKAEADLLQNRISKNIAALGLWRGELDAFEKLAFPTEESMRQYAGKFEKFKQDMSGLDKEIQKTQLETKEIQQQIDLENRNKNLPSLEDLQVQRDIRDQGWRSVRCVWLESGEPDHGFLSHFNQSDSLADAYEQSVSNVDSTTDVLQAEAKTVALTQALRTQIYNLEITQHDLKRQHIDLIQENDVLLDKWQAVWTPLEIEALVPVEMIEWYGRTRQIRDSATDYHEKVSKQKQLEKAVKSINTDLNAVFNKLNIKVPEDSNHTGLVDLARRTIKANDELGKQRKELGVRLQGLGDQGDEISQNIDENAGEKQHWQEQWEIEIAVLKLGSGTTPDEAVDFIDALDDVFAKLDEVNAAQQRIDAMNRNRKGYKNRVQEIVDQVAPHLATMESDKAATELKNLLKENLERRQEYKLLQAEKRKKTDQIAKENEKLAGNEEILRQLCIEAYISDPEKLSEVERRSRHKSSILKDESAVKERLGELAAGQPLQVFIENVRKQDPDVLSAELEKAAIEKTDLTKDREQLVADIAVSQNELKEFDGQSKAAGLAVKADGLLGKLQTNVEHYAKLNLASVILAKAIERYRKHNESPVIEAASHYFQMLTSGSFTGLKADFDSKGEPVLKAVNAEDNTALAIEALSDGTRDQLFLSLRLGGLSRHIESSGSVPFIVDDVLVHFDNERSSAALKAIGEFAKKTQIIFFTHHNHLVKLAQKVVPKTLLCTHHL